MSPEESISYVFSYLDSLGVFIYCLFFQSIILEKSVYSYVYAAEYTAVYTARILLFNNAKGTNQIFTSTN